MLVAEVGTRSQGPPGGARWGRGVRRGPITEYRVVDLLRAGVGTGGVPDPHRRCWEPESLFQGPGPSGTSLGLLAGRQTCHEQAHQGQRCASRRRRAMTKRMPYCTPGRRTGNGREQEAPPEGDPWSGHVTGNDSPFFQESDPIGGKGLRAFFFKHLPGPGLRGAGSRTPVTGGVARTEDPVHRKQFSSPGSNRDRPVDSRSFPPRPPPHPLPGQGHPPFPCLHDGAVRPPGVTRRWNTHPPGAGANGSPAPGWSDLHPSDPPGRRWPASRRGPLERLPVMGMSYPHPRQQPEGVGIDPVAIIVGLGSA